MSVRHANQPVHRRPRRPSATSSRASASARRRKGRRVDPEARAACASCSATSRAARPADRAPAPIQDRFGHLQHGASGGAGAGDEACRRPRCTRSRPSITTSTSSRKARPRRRALTVRVCDGLSCEMAGAQDLLARLPALLGADVRVIAAPCIGRCEQAPAAVVGQNPVPRATAEKRRRRRSTAEADARTCPKASSTSPPTGRRRLRAAAPVPRRRARRRDRDQDARRLGPARPGRRGLSGRPQVAHRAQRAGAAPDGRQHRRRRARHLQGPRLPRARPAPLPRRHADRRLGGRHRDDLRLPARRVPRLPRAARGRAGASCAPTPPCPACPRSSCAAAPAPTSAAKSRR